MKPAFVYVSLVFMSVTGCASPNVWIDDTQTFNINAAELNSLEVETHNGDIQIVGSPTATQIEAVVTARYGGWNMESAEKCKGAVELVSETSVTGEHRLMPRWRGGKAADWQACVNYKVIMPARLASTSTSHNGDIVIKDVDGACNVVTHNGDVSVASKSPTLRTVTHNGNIRAACDARDLTLESHNGDIHVESSIAGLLNGRISTHNGTIVAKLSESASTELACRTHNGRIRSDLPWRVTEMSRYEVIGKLGEGGGRMELESFNGNISLVK